MADHVQPDKRSDIMRRVKCSNTSCEVLFRKALRAHGLLGYRVNYRAVTGSPDVVFTKHKVAIFIDGCFWHGCPRCCRIPDANKEYWLGKIARNIERDSVVTSTLKEQGWKVVRFWEHEVTQSADACARRVRMVMSESEENN